VENLIPVEVPDARPRLGAVPRSVLLVVVFAAFLAAAVATARPASGHFRLAAVVTRVIDGDTVVARVGGRSEHVRLLGIDTPERGDCYSAQATARTRALSLGRRVTLVGDPTQASRDRYGRLLAYVVLPNGSDLDRALVAGGFAKVYIYENVPFVRAGAYLRTEAAARAKGVGLWSACGATPTVRTPAVRSGARCDSAYPTVCIRPPPPDLDCADVPYRAFKVLPPDPHRFDGDHDGIGCER
jgi:micrococcal nuclease